MITGILIAVVFLLFIFLVIYIVFAICWYANRERTYPMVNFKAFKELYVLNPKAWTLYPCNPRYHSQDGEYVAIEFTSFHDYQKYQSFASKVSRDSEYNERIENEAQFIKYMQEEINNYRERNLNEMREILEK